MAVLSTATSCSDVSVQPTLGCVLFSPGFFLLFGRISALWPVPPVKQWCVEIRQA